MGSRPFVGVVKDVIQKVGRGGISFSSLKLTYSPCISVVGEL